MKLVTYLNYGGNCKQAFEFYRQHLGAKVGMMMTFAQMPGSQQPPPGLREDSVLHARMEIAGTEIMASDAPADRYQPMRSAYLSLNVDDSAEAERIHKVLSDGGEVFMPMEETFFAHRFSMLRDKFGVSWMIIHEKPMGPPSQ